MGGEQVVKTAWYAGAMVVAKIPIRSIAIAPPILPALRQYLLIQSFII
jgi:hypothetical protein